MKKLEDKTLPKRTSKKWQFIKEKSKSHRCRAAKSFSKIYISIFTLEGYETELILVLVTSVKPVQKTSNLQHNASTKDLILVSSTKQGVDK